MLFIVYIHQRGNNKKKNNGWGIERVIKMPTMDGEECGKREENFGL